jgi:hypothetical protein
MLRALAWCGFLASLAIHIGTLNGLEPLGKAAYVFHVGLFVVAFPTLFIHNAALKSYGLWKTFRGFPLISQLLIPALLIYALATMQHLPPSKSSESLDTVKVFSSMWCYLYFLVASLLSYPPRSVRNSI